ncbi:MAG: tyrosine-type recombinase/integrase [Myxococcales bacterium]
MNPKRLTLKQYGKRWLRERKRQGLAIAGQDGIVLRLHVFPELGDMPLAEIRPHHIRDLVRKLRLKPSEKGGTLAPRTVRRVYGTLHVLLHDAVADELLVANPCVLKRHELPKNIDKDPTWRPSAVFLREEVEMLLSNAAIPFDRRVLYGLLFLTGIRFGEAAALHWCDIDLNAEPLGRLLVHRSYSFRTKSEKPTKTQQPREVPIHPALRRILEEWRSGWKATFGREVEPSDLVLPQCGRLYLRSEGDPHRAITKMHGRGHRNTNRSLRRLREDLDRVGLRHRRVHDTRRTFVSLTQADGARKDVLRWVTHGPTGDIMDLYTTLPWHAVCAEVAKLRLTEPPPSSPAPADLPPPPAAEDVDDLLRTAATQWLVSRDTRTLRVGLLSVLRELEQLDRTPI